MERFVDLVVAGGLALVAGLWPVALFGVGSLAWTGGAVVAALGCAALGAGMWSEIDSPLPGRGDR